MRTFHVQWWSILGILMVVLSPPVTLSRPPWREAMGSMDVVDPSPYRQVDALIIAHVFSVGWILGLAAPIYSPVLIFFWRFFPQHSNPSIFFSFFAHSWVCLWALGHVHTPVGIACHMAADKPCSSAWGRKVASVATRKHYIELADGETVYRQERLTHSPLISPKFRP